MRVRRGTPGMVLLTVLIVVAIAALAGTTAMYLARAEVAAARTTLTRTQSRALAWSGVQAVMSELEDQREKLLDGGEPDLTGEWDLYSEEGGRRGIVRLVAWGEGGPVAEAEGARLDLNAASADMLKLLGFDEKSAAAVVSARDRQKLLSERELAGMEGVSLAASKASGARGPVAVERDLLSLCTVFSFDPNVQSGLGENGSDHRGRQRVNLNVAWSDRLAEAVDDRFGEGSSTAVKQFFDRGTKFKGMADIVAAAISANVEPKDWAPIVDALTVTADPYLIGRVDLNHAPVEVLSVVPGISAEAAGRIVGARDSVDAAARRTPVWPVIEGILQPQEYVKAADFLTTRSLQWRVRVEAGTAAASDQEQREQSAVLADRVVLEAVIDVASERPRIAYLRDVSLEDQAERLLGADAEPHEPLVAAEPPSVVEEPGGLKLGGLELDTDLDLSSGMNKGFGDLDLGGKKEKPEATGQSKPQEAGAEAGPPAPPAAGVDRRVGRWTTGVKPQGGR